MNNSGATIWARQTIESDIFLQKPDKWFKIWFYLINKVNYKDTKQFKRGSGRFTYKEIMIATKATKAQVDFCFRHLRETNAIQTKRTTRGVIVTILNYNKYQDLETYQHDKHTTGARQTHATIQKKVRKEEEERKEKTVFWDEEFKRFWKAYDYPMNKVDAKNAYFALKRKDIAETEIAKALNGYHNFLKDKWLNQDFQQRKMYPATFLRSDRWRQYIGFKYKARL
jgi:hypothetical protein